MITDPIWYTISIVFSNIRQNIKRLIKRKQLIKKKSENANKYLVGQPAVSCLTLKIATWSCSQSAHCLSSCHRCDNAL